MQNNIKNIIVKVVDLNYKQFYKISSIRQDMTLFSCKLELNLRKKLENCCSFRKAFYGPETWALAKVDRKYLQRF